MGKQTPLFQAHIDSNAKMVEFCGWELPIHYGSLTDEHHVVRQSAGMFDVSHMLAIDISGSGSRDFLRYLLANDIDKAAVGKAMYSCMLNEQGGIIDDLIIYYLQENVYRIIVNAGNRECDIAWMQQQATHYDVNLTPSPDLAIIAVQGPQALAKIQQSFTTDIRKKIAALKPFTVIDDERWMLARTGYTGEDGYELMMPADQANDAWQKLLSNGVQPCGLGARDTLRLEAGMNLHGNDMDDTITPYESALRWTVKLSDQRDFIGKQALIDQEAAGIRRKLVGVLLQGKGVLRHGQVIHDQNGQQGMITSGTFSPTIKQAIGLASVANSAQSLMVTIRNKQLPLKMVNTPFVRKGKILIDVSQA